MRAPLPVERLLDEARFTPTHRKVFVLAAMGILLDGFDFFIMGVALPLIDQDWSLSALQIGMIGSAAVIGSIVGATMLGALTDKIGRQLAFRIDLGAVAVDGQQTLEAAGRSEVVVVDVHPGIGEQPVAGDVVLVAVAVDDGVDGEGCAAAGDDADRRVDHDRLALPAHEQRVA